MSNDTRRTFRDLFDDTDFTDVEIPIIQRDYAQGRKSAKEVREQFLADIYKTLALPADASTLPLDLDFVYGSLEGGNGTTFCLLDGQQRLTTLFLLHWYLACLDGRIESFQSFICRQGQSRFTYKVRTSSQEFCDALVNADVDFPAIRSVNLNPQKELSRTIIDSSWFFLLWQQDPTIRSILRMLDAIHNRFKGTDGFYDRLVSTENPYITFQFLNLRDFGLSDDLYIKMNARGKPLTPFEAFKARLEQLINKLLPHENRDLNGRSVPLRGYFSHKVDSSWSDLFWSYRDETNHTFDQQFMNFVRAVALVVYPQNHLDKEPTPVSRVVEDLLDFDVEFSFFKYKENHCLTPEFLHSLISILDCLYEAKVGGVPYLKDNAYYDEIDVFKRILQGGRRRVVQSEWVQFYGFCAYLIKHEPEPGSMDFYNWMRVVSNLATNTIYYHTDDFIRALVGVHKLLDVLDTGSIIDYVADAEQLRGFNQQQVQEERLKAQLMSRDDEWKACLLEAEKHSYFSGQIEFLLKFSGVLDCWSELKRCDWDDADDKRYRLAFISYFEKANNIFGDNGLREFSEYRWERALLATGDYLLSKNANKSFLIAVDRDISWKRLLRGAERFDDVNEPKRLLVKRLLYQVDSIHIEESLQTVIDEFLQDESIAETEEWRRKIVECPETIKFCGKRQIREVESDCIYLLSRVRMSSYHADLSTLHLKTAWLDLKLNRGELAPFSEVKYVSVCDESDRPHVSLIWQDKSLSLEVRYKNDAYELKFYCQNGMFPNQLKSDLTGKLSFEAAEEDVIILTVKPTQIESKLNQLVLLLRSFKGKES